MRPGNLRDEFGYASWKFIVHFLEGDWSEEHVISDHLVDEAMRGVARERVLYLIWRKPWMTVSRATYVSASLALAGWDTLPEASEARYPRIAEEDAAWTDAQRILLSSEPYAFRERDVREMKERHGKPVALVDGEWTSWYGVRAIEGLAALARFRATAGSSHRR